jgi:glucan phosphoethanolaminetransferase (alkaline phosphatase superfamily)
MLAAIKGNVKAAEMIRDTIGEKPKEQVINTNTNINIENDQIVNEVIDKLKDL